MKLFHIFNSCYVSLRRHGEAILSDVMPFNDGMSPRSCSIFWQSNYKFKVDKVEQRGVFMYPSFWILLERTFDL
ncbi:hypothetical protein Hanom_Chr14g01292471 [Helianthus anomalus]